MITLKQEIRVREIISNPRDHSTDRRIAELTGVSHWQVLFQRRLLDAVKKIPSKKANEVKNLVLAGFPSRAIEHTAKVTSREVGNIRRFFYLKKREPGDGGPIQCPTCDAMMFDKNKLGQVKFLPRRKHLASSELTAISESDALSLYRLASDMSRLGELCVINSPVFYHLAEKAEKLLGAINDKKENKPR